MSLQFIIPLVVLIFTYARIAVAVWGKYFSNRLALLMLSHDDIPFYVVCRKATAWRSWELAGFANGAIKAKSESINGFNVILQRLKACFINKLLYVKFISFFKSPWLRVQSTLWGFSKWMKKAIWKLLKFFVVWRMVAHVSSCFFACERSIRLEKRARFVSGIASMSFWTNHFRNATSSESWNGIVTVPFVRMFNSPKANCFWQECW